jgi:DNA-binding response OmpR family regulator
MKNKKDRSARTRVLLVDDERDIIELLSYNLRQQGYEVLQALNGEEALRKAQQFLPDLVLLDVMLGELDGLTICEILRHQPATTNIPIIIMTAASGQLMRLHGLSAGATDFINKPFQSKELLQRIQKVLRETPLA